MQGTAVTVEVEGVGVDDGGGDGVVVGNEEELGAGVGEEPTGDGVAYFSPLEFVGSLLDSELFSLKGFRFSVLALMASKPREQFMKGTISRKKTKNSISCRRKSRFLLLANFTHSPEVILYFRTLYLVFK